MIYLSKKSRAVKKITLIILFFVFTLPSAIYAMETSRNDIASALLQRLQEEHADIDYEKGNWADGLRAYLAEHSSAEKAGAGWQYRKNILIDYDSYVTSENEPLLKDFKTSADRASEAIGRGKSTMVFHMLRRLAGDAVFYTAVNDLIKSRASEKTSWDDIKTVFETALQKELEWFFEQWLERKGQPVIYIKNVKIEPKGLKSVVSFEVAQREKPYTISLPISLITNKEIKREVLDISKEKESFEITVDGRPEKLIIDEEYDIFRKLSEEEIPPVIGKLFGAGKKLVVLPEEDSKITVYSDLIDFFDAGDVTIKTPKEVSNSDIRDSSVLIIGNSNPVIQRLFGKLQTQPTGFSLIIKKNPLNTSNVCAIAEDYSGIEADFSFKNIYDYDNYSFIRFVNGKITEKFVSKAERGWIVPLGESIMGIEPAKALKIDEIVERVADKKIIYVGERHDSYEQHIVQLEIIRGIFRKNPNIAIGMEMFQRESQSALDDFIAGYIDEKTFLKQSAYFKNWGLDYNFYKDIIRFARDEKVPLIALNLRREIVSKVASSGIDSLTDDEKKELPASMDMTDYDYKSRLKEVFDKHPGSKNRNFDNFYQSQIIWDETMSQSIDEYLKKNPDRQVIVIAGSGHLIYGSGIPKRTFRRNQHNYAIILSDTPVVPDIADFILFPDTMEAETAPLLGILLKEEDGRVRIIGFPEGSISKDAGLKEDDIILSLDGEKISTQDDLKIFLFYKKRGDTVKAKILRKRFLFGDKEMEFNITL